MPGIEMHTDARRAPLVVPHLRGMAGAGTALGIQHLCPGPSGGPRGGLALGSLQLHRLAAVRGAHPGGISRQPAVSVGAANLARHIALHVVGALGMCVAWAALGTLLRLGIFPAAAGASAQKVWLGFVSWVFTTLPFGVGVYFALVGIQHSFFYFAQARERETQSARLAAQLSEARLGALRMQLNPHFLFNSLNAITVLVRDGNTEAASRMLELLSDVLRQVLRTGDTHETALAREVEFLERYLAIEQVRFSDRLRPRIEIDPAVARAAVPRFLLQPLVENALRHGIARRADAGIVQVSGRREGGQLVLTVRDDGRGLARRGGCGERRGAREHPRPLGGVVWWPGDAGGGQCGGRRRDRYGAPAVS